MKNERRRLKKAVVAAIIVLCVLASVFASACRTRLLVPEIEINLDNYTVSWTRVDRASGYEVEISSEELEYYDLQTYGRTRLSASFSQLPEGPYDVRVRATASKNSSYSTSEWSVTVSFDKDYYSGCTFTLINNDSAYEITGWNRPSGDESGEITIVADYRGKPVIGIGDNAFKSKSALKSVVVEVDEETGEGNLQYIGENAFYSCINLVSISLPESVEKISSGAFHSCRSMTSFVMPSQVTSIEEGTFLYCRSLETIDIGNVEQIGDSAFYGCTALSSVGSSSADADAETGAGNRSAGNGASEGGAYGRESEKFGRVEIPDAVTEIGSKAFSLCDEVKTVVVGSGVEKIGANAFQSDTALSEVIFKSDDAGRSSLTEIGDSAFADCALLKSVTLPSGLKTIGLYAFENDTSLESVNIPTSVEKIGDYAFENTEVTNSQSDELFVYVGDDGTSSDNGRWITYFNEELLRSEEKTAIGADDIGEDTVGIADYAFYAAGYFSGITFPGNLSHIGEYAFYACEAQEVIFEGLTNDRRGAVSLDLGSYSFARMTNLSNLRFSQTLHYGTIESIGDHAFYGDTYLTNADTLPDTVTSVGAYAFNLTGLPVDEYGVMYAGASSASTSLWVVGNGGTVSADVYLDAATAGIADYSFTRVGTIVTVNNINSVDYIGEGAFYKCTALETVYLSEEIKEIPDYTFYGCTSMEYIGTRNTVFSDLVGIGRSAFYECSSLKLLRMADSPLEYIGKYAFYGCTSLTDASLPTGGTLTEIDDFAFYKSGVTDITIPASIERIGGMAFYKCEKLESLAFAAASGEDGSEGEIESSDAGEAGPVGGENAGAASGVASGTTAGTASGTTAGTAVIDEYAFYKCTALKAVDIPGYIGDVGDYAFYKCTGCTSLTIGEGVTTIGVGAFGYLPISTLRIPSGVKSIGNYAFMRCSSLTSVIIPSTVEEIGDHAFYAIDNATFYTDADGVLPLWSSRFNSSYRPMVWGCELSEDGSYVVSFTTGDGVVSNVVRINEVEKGDESVSAYSRLCSAPERDGYVFLGWALTPDGDVVYADCEIDLVPYGTTLYAVWELAL